jgi:hypothetical protein
VVSLVLASAHTATHTGPVAQDGRHRSSGNHARAAPARCPHPPAAPVYVRFDLSSDDENSSDQSMQESREIADEVISIASSAAATQREELERRVVQLETQLLLQERQQRGNRSSRIHDDVQMATAPIIPTIMQMDLPTLWWMEQWIDQRQQEIKSTGTPADIEAKTKTLRNCKDWAFKNKKKAEAGMRFIRGTTPDRPTAGGRNAAAGAD